MTNTNLPVQAKPIVSIVNQSVSALSTDVAEYFGKNHAHVMRDIRNLIEQESSLNEANFGLVDYVDAKGERRPCYRMDRTGFVLLAMGFTGEKALKFKLAYIRAFDAMEKQLIGLESMTLTPSQQRAIQGAVAQKAMGNSFAFKAIYRELKKHFDVGSYKQIPSSRFEEAFEFVRTTTFADINTGERIYLLSETELKSMATVAYYYMLAKPTLLRLSEALRAMDSSFASKLYSLATEPMFSYNRVVRALTRNGFEIKQPALTV